MSLRFSPPPRSSLLVLAAACCVWFGRHQSATAAEPFLEFIAGLRERGYYDTAQTYLDEISARPDLPDEVRQVLPYERALILLAAVRDVTASGAKRTQLDAAEAALEQFVQGAPQHALAGQANTQRAKIRLQKARVAIWDADDPANSGSRGEFLAEARQFIGEARQIFQAAFEQHKTAVNAFPLGTSDESVVQKRKREDAENLYLHSKLDLAETTYWMAQTCEPGSTAREEQLTEAQDEYAKIHAEHRLQKVGLIARLWQGKCFEEMGRLGEALGLYKEILDHPGTETGILDLQARALWFQLICLNKRTPAEYQLVIDAATAWRNGANALLKNSEIGRGIQFEQARALEGLGTARAADPAQSNNLLTQALAIGRTLARSPGQFKAPAAALVRRVAAALKRPEEDPKSFDEAFGVGAQFTEDLKRMYAQIAQLKSEGKTQEAAELEATIEATGAEMTRMFDLALRLARPDTDAAQLASAQRQLAFGYFVQKRYYEAAAMAEYAALHLPPEQDENARGCAYLVVAAFHHAYTAADRNNRQFEEQQTIAAAEALIARWPDSDNAADARETIGKIFYNQGDKAKAGDWWVQTPPSAENYAALQVSGGSAYWEAYLAALAAEDDERPAADLMQQWLANAERHVEIGIKAREAQLPQGRETPADLAISKLTLAQIRNLKGAYTTQEEVTGALELLTQSPHSVIEAVEVPPGESRPDDPKHAKSAHIAGQAYQQLLRTYIGLRDVDKAADTRSRLEEIAAGDDSASLTQIYVAFGQELQRELEQLRTSGQTQRLDEVRAGFEEFLNSIYERPQGQTFGSLLWIAETYTSLAEGSEDNAAKATDFFAKAAATYDKMLADPTVGDDATKRTVIKLRLTDCRRRQQDYPAAEQVLLEAVRDSSNAPNVQFEAARLYQDWGSSSSAHWEKLQIAIEGQEAPPMWGWAGLASRLQRSLQLQDDPRLQQMHIDARYSLAECRRLMALQQTSDAEREKHLESARVALEAFARISGPMPADDFRRFDQLYQQVLGELGRPVVALSDVLGRPASAGESNSSVAIGGNSHSNPIPVAADTADAAAQSGGRTNYAMIAILALAGLAAIVGLYLLAVGQDKKRHRYAVTAAPPGTSAAPPPITPATSKPSAASVRSRKRT
jgi:hypothetical protein